MNEIRIVVPITTDLRLEEHTEGMSDELTRVTARTITTGPDSIEGYFDEAIAVPGTVKAAIEAEQEGCAGIVIDCMGDPGVEAAREMVSIPVIGPSRSSMYAAASLGHRFGVVTVLDRLIDLFHDMATSYGMADRVASCRSIDIPVLELEDDPDRLMKELVVEAVAAVKVDRADVLILGCTGMFGAADALRAGLATNGIDGVPVIDPTPLAVEYAKLFANLGLTHSRKAFPTPRAKEITGYDIP